MAIDDTQGNIGPDRLLSWMVRSLTLMPVVLAASFVSCPISILFLVVLVRDISMEGVVAILLVQSASYLFMTVPIRFGPMIKDYYSILIHLDRFRVCAFTHYSLRNYLPKVDIGKSIESLFPSSATVPLGGWYFERWAKRVEDNLAIVTIDLATSPTAPAQVKCFATSQYRSLIFVREHPSDKLSASARFFILHEVGHFAKAFLFNATVNLGIGPGLFSIAMVVLSLPSTVERNLILTGLCLFFFANLSRRRHLRDSGSIVDEILADAFAISLLPRNDLPMLKRLAERGLLKDSSMSLAENIQRQAMLCHNIEAKLSDKKLAMIYPRVGFDHIALVVAMVFLGINSPDISWRWLSLISFSLLIAGCLLLLILHLLMGRPAIMTISAIIFGLKSADAALNELGIRRKPL